MASCLTECYPVSDVPFDQGWLKVSDIHEIYYEQSGKIDGNPVIYVHGGPGSGCTANCRKYFDPEVYRVILMDQRGAGKSKPHAELRENTTWDLLEDMEKLRKHLNIDKWVVFGGSWGSTLSLLYSIRYTEYVKCLIIRGIFTLRREEVLWLYQNGASYIFPDYWEDFIAPIPQNEQDDLVTAYYKRLTGDNPEECLKCAIAWAKWELRISVVGQLNPEAIENRLKDTSWVLSFSKIECHFFVNGGWFDDPEYILNNINDQIRKIPITIIQGRYDIITPMKTAWELYKRWPEAEFLIMPKSGHSVSDTNVRTALLNAADKYKYF